MSTEERDEEPGRVGRSLEQVYAAWRDLPFPKLADAVPSTPELDDMHGDLVLVDLWVAEALTPFVKDGVVSVPRVDVRAGISSVRERAVAALDSLSSSDAISRDDVTVVADYVERQIRYADALLDVYGAFLLRNQLTPGDAGPQRQRLGFAEAASEAFDDAMFARGFVRSSQDVFRVKYESPAGSLAVCHDPLSYDLTLEFAPLAPDSPTEPFAMVDVIRAHDEPAAQRYRVAQGVTQSGVRDGLQQLLAELAEFGGPLLSGDRSVAVRTVEARQHAEIAVRELREFRSAVVAAMQLGDWSQALEILRARDFDLLTGIDKRRLEYVARQLADPPGR